MWMGSSIGTFVKIHPPDSPWSGCAHLAVSCQQCYGNPVGNCPGDRLLDFRINNTRQGMHAYYLTAFTGRNDYPLLPRLLLKMKQHGAAAIHLKVKVASGQIRTRGEEKFDTAVPANSILMCSSCCPNVSVLDSKHQAYGHVVVGKLHLCLWEMIGFLPHIVLDQFRWNVFPRIVRPT